MASIIDSIRSVYQDNYSLLKIGIFAYIAYILFSALDYSRITNPVNNMVGLFIVFFFSGFCSIIINNRINQNLESLPTLNPIKLSIVAFKSTLLVLPFSILSFFVVSYVVGLFSFEGLPQLIAIWIIRVLILSMTITALLNFSEKFDIKDGLNPSKMIAGVADVLVYTIISVIVLLLFGAVSILPVLYLVYSFLDIGPLFHYMVAFFVTLNLAFLADYWGQLHFEIESRNNYY